MPSSPALRADGDRLLLRAARHTPWSLGLLGVGSVGTALAQVLLPAAIGRAVDAVLSGRAAASWLTACALLVAVLVLASTVTMLVTGTAAANATAWLRVLVAGHALRCGPSLLSPMPAGDVTSRVVGGTAEAGTAPASTISAVCAVVLPAGSVVALGLIDPWLLLAFAVAFPALAVLTRTLLRRSADVSLGYQQAQGAIAARLLDALAGARTIAAAGTVSAERSRILAPLPLLRRHGDDSWRVQGRAMGGGMLVLPAVQVVVLAVAGVLLARRQISAGQLVAAGQYGTLAVGIGASLGQLSRLGRARGGARRISGVLACPPVRHGVAEIGPGAGRLVFHRVTAGQVLRDLDLVVPAGRTVAVVGRSGAGKSTLAALAGRLADPDSGTVTLDGVPLPSLTAAALRTAVVYAFEVPALLGSTVLDAIRLGAWEPSLDAVLTATLDSRSADFLSRLPGGLDNPLDQTPMSGGEQQRLGLARAFAHAGRAKVLVLDDATSSLDTVTEMLIGEVLTGELGGLTRLLVAHRATAAARADLVAWLDGGRVRALAPHHELWGMGAYRAVFGA